MQITRWDPFTALARLDRDFDDLVRRTWAEPAATGFVPAVEAVRDGRDVLVKVELPGIDPERDVEITVHRGRLTVSGERRAERSEQVDGALVRELRYGSFRREFALPEGASADRVEASYDAGMLTVRVRDAVPASVDPVRVPVQAGAVTVSTPSSATQEQPQN